MFHCTCCKYVTTPYLSISLICVQQIDSDGTCMRSTWPTHLCVGSTNSLSRVELRALSEGQLVRSFASTRRKKTPTKKIRPAAGGRAPPGQPPNAAHHISIHLRCQEYESTLNCLSQRAVGESLLRRDGKTRRAHMFLLLPERHSVCIFFFWRSKTIIDGTSHHLGSQETTTSIERARVSRTPTLPRKQEQQRWYPFCPEIRGRRASFSVLGCQKDMSRGNMQHRGRLAMRTAILPLRLGMTPNTAQQLQERGRDRQGSTGLSRAFSPSDRAALRAPR